MAVFALLIVLVLLTVRPVICEDDVFKYDGRLCAFFDANYDTFTDVLVLSSDHTNVAAWLAYSGTLTDRVNFKEFPRSAINATSGKKIVNCAVADFNGDSFVDVLLTLTDQSNKEHPPTSYSAQVWFGQVVADGSDLIGTKYKLGMNATFDDLVNQPVIMNYDADKNGCADLVLQKESGLMCSVGKKNMKVMGPLEPCFVHDENNSSLTVSRTFMHTYVDLLGAHPNSEGGDLTAEFLVGMDDGEDNGRGFAEIWVWKWVPSSSTIHPKWTRATIISEPHKKDDKSSSVLCDWSEGRYGLISVGDFDADGVTDVLVPYYKPDENQLCLFIWHRTQPETDATEGKYASLLLTFTNGDQSWNLVVDEFNTILLRVGDSTSDGYPDLLTVLQKGDVRRAFLLVNEPASAVDLDGWQRTFAVRWAASEIVPAAVASGEIESAAFFDVFEDGILDYVFQYKDHHDKYFFVFKMNPESVDATFLKVEVYTPTCGQSDYECHDGKTPSSVASAIGGSITGSVVSYNGASVRYRVETETSSMLGLHTQGSQTGYRALQLPFALFGMGRNPNFVEVLYAGVPAVAYPDAGEQQDLEQAKWEQIVPNSRMYIVPPSQASESWIGKLYVTPSRLVIISFLTLCALCLLVLLCITVLWYRERQQDLREREAELHRFNFAM